MPYRLRLGVRNPGSQPEEATVYAGTVFEVQDPFSGVQNLAVWRDVSFNVPGGETRVVEISAKCLNPRLAAPKDTPMRITSLVVIPSAAGSGPGRDDGPIPAAE